MSTVCAVLFRPILSPEERSVEAKTQAPSIATGPITRQLLLFFFPILFGIFFQQLYNTVGTVIVGSFVGTNIALAAAGGVAGQLVNLFVGFFVGLSSGCGVIISQYYNTHDRNAISRGVRTALVFSLISGIMIVVPGLALARLSLRVMSLSDEITPETSAYPRIYSLSVIPSLFYSMGVAALRAIGDPRRLFYFPILSCLNNTVFDLAFMISLHMGVAGAAPVAILLQVASAIMVFYVLLYTDSEVRLSPRELHMDFGWLKKMICISFPAGLQNTMYTISNIIVQVTVNSFGTNTIAAVAAYGKTGVLPWMIISAFDVAITTFVGQSYGTGQVRRVFQGFHVSFVFFAFTTLFPSAIIWFFGMGFLYFFTKDPAVLAIYRRLIHYVVPFLITYIPVELCSDTLHDVDSSWILMIVTMVDVYMLRLFWIFLAVSLHRDILTLMTTCPISWITTSVTLSPYPFLTRHHYRPKNLVEQNEKNIAV